MLKTHLLVFIAFLFVAMLFSKPVKSQSNNPDGHLVISGTSAVCPNTTHSYTYTWVKGTNPDTEFKNTDAQWNRSGGGFVGGSTGEEVDIKWFSNITTGWVNVKRFLVMPPSIKSNVSGRLDVKVKSILTL